MAYTGRPSPNRDIFSSNTLTKLIARLIRQLGIGNLFIYIFSGFTEVITCKGFQNIKLYLAEFMKTAPAGYSVGHRA